MLMVMMMMMMVVVVVMMVMVRIRVIAVMAIHNLWNIFKYLAKQQLLAGGTTHRCLVQIMHPPDIKCSNGTSWTNGCCNRKLIYKIYKWWISIAAVHCQRVTEQKHSAFHY